MDDLISRQAAIDVLNVGTELLRRVLDETDIVGSEREKYEWGLGLIESYILDMKELPSAQRCEYWDSESNFCALNRPSAQRKGRIIIRSNMLDGEDCYCSECDHWALLPDYKFCPYCGVAFEDVISERETMEEFMYGQDMGNPEDGRL